MAPVKGKPAQSSTLAFMSLLFVAMALPLAGPVFISQQLAKEEEGYAQVFGETKAAVIISRASAWFRTAFVDSGIIARSMSTGDGSSARTGLLQGLPALPKPPSKESAPGGEKASAPTTSPTPAAPSAGNKVVRHWMGGFWSILYLGLVRISAFIVTFPLVLTLGIAIIIEGEARRKLKWVMFGGSDPKRYRIGGMLALWCPMMAGFSLFLPGRLPPLTLSALLVAGCLGYALWSANQQKPM